MTDLQSLGGIVNMGATCYANSVIQCFRHCTKIPQLFSEERYVTLFKKKGTPLRARQQKFTSEFADIVRLLQACKKGQSVRPAGFWKEFTNSVQDSGFEHLIVKMPHDSYEFYLCILDIVHESLSQEVNMKISRPPPTSEQEIRIYKALDVWKQEFHNKYSPLVDLYYGLMHFVIECENCKNKSHRWEPFTALKGVVPTNGGNVPLLDMLQEEFKPETIPGYDCEHCRPGRQNAVRRCYIWRLPVYTVVVLKRFTPDGRKINTPMEGISGDVSFKSLFSDESPERVSQMTYRLNSIVDHHGGAGGGHYTAQCKSLANGAWSLYDDESCHSIPGPMYGSSTYMLWFERNAS